MTFAEERRQRPCLLLNFQFVIVLLAFALRTYKLGAQSIWFDEGWSWHLATLPLAEMAQVTAGDRSPVLYYGLLHYWLQLAGQTEFVMRYFSVLADSLAVLATMALAHKLTGRRWAAGVLYALCPFAVFYAQETRMYALVAALCALSSWLLLVWAGRRQWSGTDKRIGALIGSAVCLALAIHTHYYAVFLLPAHGLLALLWGWRAFGRWLVAALAIWAAVVPWLLYAAGGFAYDDGFYFPLNTVDGRMVEWLQAFISGGFGYAPAAWLVWVFVAVLLVVLIGYARARRWRDLFTLVVLVVGPLLAAAVAVRVVYPNRSVFHPRYLIYVAPLACVLLAAAPAKPMLRRSSVSSLFFLLPVGLFLSLNWLPSLYAYFTQPNVIRDDYRGAVRHVVEALDPQGGDIVIMSRDNYAIRYYWPPSTTVAAPLLAAPTGLHGVLGNDRLVLQYLQNYKPKRVRLMLWQDDVVDPQKFIETSLWADGRQLGEFNFGRIRLPLYAMSEFYGAALRGRALSRVFCDSDYWQTKGKDGQCLHVNAEWSRAKAIAGDWFYVVLWWDVPTVPQKNYKVFIHVVDHQNRIRFQQDKAPLNELLPMTRWQAGETIRDAYAMVVPADLPAGTYRVFFGVYDPATGARLREYGLGETMVETFSVEIVAP